MNDSTLKRFLGNADAANAFGAARDFLQDTSTEDLLDQVGRRVHSVPEAVYPDKRWFQQSYAGADPGQDLVTGQGLFYLSEDGRLRLDCTAGHYQMTWGYRHPELERLACETMDSGIVWDNHSNIPPAPVKHLSARLVGLANGVREPGDELVDDPDTLNTVLLGTCTGTVACAGALKLALVNQKVEKPDAGKPAFIVMEGNYHGTDLFTQRLRGMWTDYFNNIEVIPVQPNAPEELAGVFERCGERVAGFWAEPIMMNREAIVLDPEYLQQARRLCDETGAVMIIDEIQTGFWFPEVLVFHRFGIEPDVLVLGKGLTAGFHPLSGLVYKRKLDRLEQYDAISTNGNAALASCVALGCIDLVEREASRIGRVGEFYNKQMHSLCEEFPDLLAGIHGAGHMSAMKFRDRNDALGFHREAVEQGLWVRAHAYHEGHSTVLTKFALPLDRPVAAFTVARFRQLLQQTPWKAQ